MRVKRNLYFVHRWLGLIVGLQLLAWSVSGFTFTLLDIDDVHGDLERRPKRHEPVRVERVALTPAEVRAAASAYGIEENTIARMTLRERFGRTVYELFNTANKPLAVVDATDGQIIDRITEEEARSAALGDFMPDVAVASVELLEGEAPLEYRGGPMPVYRVILEHPKQPHLYVSPVTGTVLTRRNKPWRMFDFFWMLHIMDYRGRDDFNHPLLTTMSLIAILTSASGLILWVWRLPRRNRRAALARKPPVSPGVPQAST